MKSAGAAAAAAEKAIRHRKFHWCRLRNDFVDMPLWRVVADALNLPLPSVQIFAVRLDILANKSIPRGSVEDFDADEFAAALAIRSEDAARLYAALEERGWIEQGRLTNFFERNPDKDDPTAAERKERERGFRAALRELARLERLGHLSPAERTQRETQVHALRDQGRHGALTWLEQQSKLATLLHLSTSHACHIVTGVTVTPRAEQNFEQGPVDNAGAAERGTTAGPSDENAAARAWCLSTGVKIVAQRIDEVPTKAALRVQRWLAQHMSGDAAALRTIIESVADGDATVSRFLALVTDSIERWKRRPQPALPLMPPRPGRRTGTDDG
jgi:hypothetical protein